MKARIYPIIVCLCAFSMALFAVPAEKAKQKGKQRKNRPPQDVVLPPDKMPTVSNGWHTWTAASGEKLEAKFKALHNGIVSVEKKDLSLVRFPLSRLSQSDQDFAKACAAIQPKAPLSQDVVNKAAARLDLTINTALKANKLEANPTIPDTVFLRRIYVDALGRIPSAEEAQSFLQDTSPDKRSKLINQLLNSPGYTMQMFNWLADMLRVKDDYGKGAKSFLYEDWLKEQIAMNVTWDQMVRQMITADGKLNQNGAAGYLLRDAQMPLDGVSNLLTTFLGANVACAQCHDHPFAEWSQHDFYSMAAFFGATDGFHEKVYRDARRLYKSDELSDVNQKLVRSIIANSPYNLVDLTKNKLKFPEDYKYKDAKPGEQTQPNLIRWSDTSNAWVSKI